MIDITDYLRLDLVDMALVFTSTILIFLFAKKYFWKNVKEYLDNREKYIQTQLDEASKKESEGQLYLDKANKELSDVQEKASTIIAMAENDAKNKANEILESAKLNAKRVKEKASEDIEQEKRAAMLEIKDEVSDLAILVAKKLIEKDMDTNIQKEYINDFINVAGENKWKA